MKTLKEKIIDEWLKTKEVTVHPSYRELAKKFKVGHPYCYQVIKEYLKTKEKQDV